jgi:hypothetical protein
MEVDKKKQLRELILYFRNEDIQKRWNEFEESDSETCPYDIGEGVWNDDEYIANLSLDNLCCEFHSQYISKIYEKYPHIWNLLYLNYVIHLLKMKYLI